MTFRWWSRWNEIRTPISYCSANLAAIAAPHSSATALSGLQHWRWRQADSRRGINNELTMNGVDASDVAAMSRRSRTPWSRHVHHPSNTFDRDNAVDERRTLLCHSDGAAQWQGPNRGGSNSTVEVNTTEAVRPGSPTLRRFDAG